MRKPSVKLGARIKVGESNSWRDTHISRGHSLYANMVGFATFLGFSELLV